MKVFKKALLVCLLLFVSLIIVSVAAEAKTKKAKTEPVAKPKTFVWIIGAEGDQKVEVPEGLDFGRVIERWHRENRNYEIIRVHGPVLISDEPDSDRIYFVHVTERDPEDN